MAYINDREDLHVEEIEVDKHFWETEMLPKLCTFYKDHMLKAIVQQ